MSKVNYIEIRDKKTGKVTTVELGGAGGSGVSGQSGSLIIEKILESDMDSAWVTFTQDELDKLKADPNAVVKIISGEEDDNVAIYFTQLVPNMFMTVHDQKENYMHIPVFYCKALLASDDMEVIQYFALRPSDSPDNLLTYYIEPQNGLLDDSGTFPCKTGTVTITTLTTGSLDSLISGTLSDDDYDKLHKSYNDWTILTEYALYRYNPIIERMDAGIVAIFHPVSRATYYSSRWACVLPGATYFLTINADKTWSMTSYSNNQISVKINADATVDLIID